MEETLNRLRTVADDLEDQRVAYVRRQGRRIHELLDRLEDDLVELGLLAPEDS